MTRSNIQALLHQEDFDRAEDFLRSWADNIRTPTAELCLKLSKDDVKVTGWEEVWASIAKLDEARPITAVGADLSGHVDGDSDERGEANPGIETSYYDESSFPFSTVSHGQILEEIDEKHGSSWQGCFTDTDYSLQARGLGGLYSAREALRERTRMRQDDVHPEDETLSTHFIVLHFHRAIARDVRAKGLPRPMPIIVGEHDFGGPYLISAYMAETVADTRDVAELILDQRRAKASLEHKRTIEKWISEMAESRDNVRDWPKRVNPDKRAIYRDFVDSRAQLSLGAWNITTERPVCNLDDAEFALLMNRVREHHGLETEKVPPPSRLQRVLGFGKRGL